MRAEEEAGRAREQLTATQTDIGTAVDMVRNVDSAFAHISGDVGEVHVLLADMARANEAQATAIRKISVAVTAMDQSTQQNAAMVEQTSASARALQPQRVNRPARRRVPPRQPRPPPAGRRGWRSLGHILIRSRA